MLTQEEMMFLYRDMMTALDVGKKAEMGYYDVEFNTFGCTYFDGQERNYSISSSAAKLYDLLENAALEDIYPTMLLEATFKKPIPRGFKELLEFDLKLDLAKKMQQDFSIDFLQALQALAHALKQNNASDLLNTYMDSLECSFQRDKLNLFENTLCLTVSQQKLSLKDYALLLKRLDEERDTISTELRPHDIFNQAFYAFAYETGGRKTGDLCGTDPEYAECHMAGNRDLDGWTKDTALPERLGADSPHRQRPAGAGSNGRE